MIFFPSFLLFSIYFHMLDLYNNELFFYFACDLKCMLINVFKIVI